jgi:hypothetical protein
MKEKDADGEFLQIGRFQKKDDLRSSPEDF